MRESARRQFDLLRKIGAPQINRALIAQLDAKAEAGKAPADWHLIKANLARRCGDLELARTSFRAHLQAINGDPAADLPRYAATPLGFMSNATQTIAPVLVIDDLLPTSQMEQLHRHACSLQPQFRDANTNSQKAEYDPDKRQTLVTWAFEYRRDFFLQFVKDNLAQFQLSLGLPAFEIDRIEIKMTCHTDGCFFKTHADNHAAIGEAGRAISWLYYFGEDPPRQKGGELFVLDSDIEGRTHSPTWFTRVEAKPNRFVAFPSWYHHAVGPTQLPGNQFSDGRFAISSHIRKPADGLDWPAP